MSYHDALSYLAQKTSVIELCDQWGGRLVVCPEWNGRILTSTCEGLEGESFGFVNIQAIDNENVENFGGEDQWTTSPLNHVFVVKSLREDKAVLQRTLRTMDAEGLPVELDISRSVTLLDKQVIGTLFGDIVANSLDCKDVSVVGIHTENTVQPLREACIASRLRGMFNASSNRAIVLSTPPEDFWSGQYPMNIDYLGGSPHGRIRHLPQTLLVRADGQGICQITIPYPNAPPILGAVELRFGTLTLWTFDLPNDSTDDVIRIYNSGRSCSDELNETAYFEVNCFSAAHELLPGDSLTYCQSVLHLNAGNDILDDLVRQIFDVSLEDISQKMLR